MDLYLPDDFVPHAEYAAHGRASAASAGCAGAAAWTDSLHATHAREEVFADATSEDWLGGEALLTPTLQRDLRATRERYELLHATTLNTDSSDWCAL